MSPAPRVPTAGLSKSTCPRPRNQRGRSSGCHRNIAQDHEITNAVPSACADGVNWHTRCNRSELVRRPANFVCEICFIDDDDRSGAAFPHQGEIALHARQVKIAIQRRHDEDDIDIRRQELRGDVRLTPCGPVRWSLVELPLLWPGHHPSLDVSPRSRRHPGDRSAARHYCGCGPLCPPSAQPLRLRPDNGFDARLSRARNSPSAAWAVNSSCRRPLQPKASRVMFQSP